MQWDSLSKLGISFGKMHVDNDLLPISIRIPESHLQGKGVEIYFCSLASRRSNPTALFK
jgi:hypothetical protein